LKEDGAFFFVLPPSRQSAMAIAPHISSNAMLLQGAEEHHQYNLTEGGTDG
jgi:hypothetical protein